MNLPARHTMEARLVYDSQGKPRSILFTGCDLASADCNVATLRIMGFEVESAVSPHAALEQTRRFKFDFIICALSPRGGTGLDLARQIRTSGGPSAGAKLLAIPDHAVGEVMPGQWIELFDGVLHPNPSRFDLRLALMKLLEPAPRQRSLQETIAARALTKRNPVQPVRLPPPVFLAPPPEMLYVPSKPAQGAPPVAPVIVMQPAAAVPTPAARPAVKTWRGFALGLPEEFTSMVIKLAAVQAHCMIVDIAKANALNSNAAVLKARRKLLSLAESFEITGITDLLAKHAGTRIGAHAPELFKALERWRTSHMTFRAAA